MIYLYLSDIVLYLFRCLIRQTSAKKGTKNSLETFISLCVLIVIKWLGFAITLVSIGDSKRAKQTMTKLQNYHQKI